MSVVLDPAIQTQLDKGISHVLPLVSIFIPNNTVHYVVAPRPLTYNSTIYQPNRFMDASDLVDTLDVDIGDRSLVFSDIPVGSEAINDLEALQYTRAPVTIARLVVDPSKGVPNGILGIADTTFHQIANVDYEEGAEDDNAESSLTFTVNLEPLGASGRDQTHALRSHEEQILDNDPNDTLLKEASIVQTIPREWGQRSG